MNRSSSGAAALVLSVCLSHPVFAQATGTLVLDSKPFTSRYGERKEIQLPAGQYTLTCVGLIPEGGLSVDKVLSKGAYFNEDVLSFTIEAGQTTVLEVSSVIRKENTFLLKFFVPEVSVSVVANGVGFEPQPINLRGDASVAWDDYSGSLKFVAK